MKWWGQAGDEPAVGPGSKAGSGTASRGAQPDDWGKRLSPSEGRDGPPNSSQTLANWGKSSGGHQGGQSRGLRELGLFNLDEGQLQQGIIAACPCLWGGYRGDAARLFSAAWWEGERQGAPLNQERFQLDRRKSQSRQLVGRQAGEAGQGPSLEAFKTWQDKAVSSLGWPCGWPCFEQEVGLRDLLRFLPTCMVL